jgi:hypothetical protein
MSAIIVAPAIGALAASGSGAVATEVPVSYVIAGITHRFVKDISASDALFLALDVSDNDPAPGQSGYNVLMDQSAFAAALKALMDSATGGAVGGAGATIAAGTGVAAAVAQPKTLAELLTSEVRSEVQAALDSNDILAFLEANTFSGLTITVDTSGGAADIAGKLNNNDDLKIMFQQIPNRETVIGETVTSTGALPVRAGDKISFVFDLTATISVTETENPAPTDGAPASGASGNATDPGEGVQALPGYGSPGANAAATTYASRSRRVEFLFTVA